MNHDSTAIDEQSSSRFGDPVDREGGVVARSERKADVGELSEVAHVMVLGVLVRDRGVIECFDGSGRGMDP